MRQPDGLPDHLQEEGERHGDEAAAAGHDAVGQAKAALEVVTKDNQRGLEGKGAAAAEEDPIREITNFQRPSGKKNHSKVVTLCRGKEAFFPAGGPAKPGVKTQVSHTTGATQTV